MKIAIIFALLSQDPNLEEILDWARSNQSDPIYETHLDCPISDETAQEDERILRECLEGAEKKTELSGDEAIFSEEALRHFKIWGLNGEFDPAYEQNHDFLSTIGLLSSLDEMTQSEADLLKLKENSLLFNGKIYRCHCNHVLGELKDCCGKMGGLLGDCSSEEKDLRKLRDQGRCHRIPGDIKEGIFHFDKIRVFCCFPTKLLRIFNEKAREKLGIGWGVPKAPKCEGMSIETLSQSDLTHLDFSEALDAFSANPFDEAGARQKIESFLKNAPIKQPSSDEISRGEP